MRVPLIVPIFGVWGANTGVGKTLVSAALVAAQVSAARATLFLKPLQTGFPSDSDAELVARAATRRRAACSVVHSLGDHAAAAAGATGWTSHLSSSSAAVQCRTLFAWNAAVGPHVAVQREGRPVSDDVLVDATAREVNSWAASFSADSQAHALALVEGAGGVASPGPSGRLQCDVYRRMRLPVVLVGDGRLGCVPCLFAATQKSPLTQCLVAQRNLCDGVCVRNVAPARLRCRSCGHPG